jgi:hypothetical protein
LFISIACQTIQSNNKPELSLQVDFIFIGYCILIINNDWIDSGDLPAIILSGFRPVEILKGN